MGTYYRPNRPRFVDETVDDEALIMDMVRGNYYSCVGASADAWNALSTGVPADDVVAMLAARYGIADTTARTDLDGFVRTLLDEEVLVATTEPTTPDTPPDTPPTTALPPGVYATLALERYGDLADLILLDPVHDVSEAGWPRPTTDA